MNLIAAVDENWGLGCEGELLVRLTQDMKFFRGKTTGNVIVIGRKTLESFPGGKPLPNRVHIVLTGNKAYACEGVIICHSIEEVLEETKKYREKEIFVAGGGSVYRQFLPHCDKAYITKVFAGFSADTFLDNLDKNQNWTLVQEGERQEEKGLAFSFTTYERTEK